MTGIKSQRTLSLLDALIILLIRHKYRRHARRQASFWGLGSK